MLIGYLRLYYYTVLKVPLNIYNHTQPYYDAGDHFILHNIEVTVYVYLINTLETLTMHMVWNLSNRESLC